MNAIQLEFPLEEKFSLEIKIDILQKENKELRESFRKVQRKLFSEISEIKKEINNAKHVKLHGEADSLFYEAKDRKEESEC